MRQIFNASFLSIIDVDECWICSGKDEKQSKTEAGRDGRADKETQKFRPSPLGKIAKGKSVSGRNFKENF